MYLSYTILLLLGGLYLLPRFVWRSLRGVSHLRDFHSRFSTGVAARLVSHHTGECLWFHAASVGEVQGVQPILAALRKQFPALRVVLSTYTPAGRAIAQRVAPDVAVFLLPVDFPWLMRRLVRQLRPRALIVQETELWPHLFQAAAQQHVPIVLVNGRLSPRAFGRYLWVRPFMQTVLARVTLLLAQTVESAQRFQCLGAPPQRVCVVGNTNIDRALLAAQPTPPTSPLVTFTRGHSVLVGGSTHEGEETILLSVYRRLRQQYPDLLLVLAPRHMDRVAVVMQHVQASGLRALRRSRYARYAAETSDGAPVIVLDTLGELAALYGLCTVAFVGGSLVPIGGHNILEPAVYARPVFFGPHMHHFPELATMLCVAGGAVQVHSEGELYDGIARLLARPDEAYAMGQRALQTLMANRGALDRTLQAITALLTQPLASTDAGETVRRGA
jgi:3-deoxy-D-manno-octulosonic-acid transferase